MRKTSILLCLLTLCFAALGAQTETFMLHPKVYVWFDQFSEKINTQSDQRQRTLRLTINEKGVGLLKERSDGNTEWEDVGEYKVVSDNYDIVTGEIVRDIRLFETETNSLNGIKIRTWKSGNRYETVTFSRLFGPSLEKGNLDYLPCTKELSEGEISNLSSTSALAFSYGAAAIPPSDRTIKAIKAFEELATQWNDECGKTLLLLQKNGVTDKTSAPEIANHNGKRWEIVGKMKAKISEVDDLGVKQVFGKLELINGRIALGYGELKDGIAKGTDVDSILTSLGELAVLKVEIATPILEKKVKCGLIKPELLNREMEIFKSKYLPKE